MKADNAEHRVRRVVSQILCCDPDLVGNDQEFVSDLGADSLETVEITMLLEDEFGIEIPDPDAEKLKNINDVVAYIAGLPEAPAP